ncbi:MAG: hypothetical protein HRF46_00865 [Acidobacteriota bacterium]|jgi:cell division protein FtsB
MTSLGRKLLVRGLLALAPVVAGLAAWGWWAGFSSLREAQSELHRLVERRDALTGANRQLRRQLAGLRHDREAQVRAAREVLLAAAPGEVVVVVLPSPTPGFER